jgi:sugar-specific transcriptional regulator TrmB
MSEQTDKLIMLLEPFGLMPDEARIYLVLLENGTLSALEISRRLKMGRTKVYRILDTLISKELVINEYDEVGFKFVASEPTKLELLLNQRAADIEALKQSLPSLTTILEQQRGSNQPGSKVRYYRGQRGLYQVNFNMLAAKGEFLSYEVSNAEAFMDHEDAEQLRREIVVAKIKVRTITNLTHMKQFTDVTEIVKHYWEIRYIDPKEFEIKADVFIYNDVYALCHYLKDGDVFCVEMINPELARMQKQLFEYLWTRAQALTIIGDHGEAAL